MTVAQRVRAAITLAAAIAANTKPSREDRKAVGMPPSAAGARRMSGLAMCQSEAWRTAMQAAAG